MSRFGLILAVLLIPTSGYARPKVPPSTIQITMVGLTDPVGSRHNGTYTLKNYDTPKDGLWNYQYADNEDNPRVHWGITISPDDDIVVSAGGGQSRFAWHVKGDILITTSAGMVTVPGVAAGPDVGIKAIP